MSDHDPKSAANARSATPAAPLDENEDHAHHPRQPEGPDEARFTLYCACKECMVAIQADTRIRFFCEACSWWRTSGPHFHDCNHTMLGKQGVADGQ